MLIVTGTRNVAVPICWAHHRHVNKAYTADSKRSSPIVAAERRTDSLNIEKRWLEEESERLAGMYGGRYFDYPGVATIQLLDRIAGYWRWMNVPHSPPPLAVEIPEPALLGRTRHQQPDLHRNTTAQGRLN